MNSATGLVAAVAGLLVIAIMLAAPWSTRATGQPAAPNVRKGEHKAAPPALLDTPEAHEPVASS